MSIDNPSVIDAIGTDAASGEVVLTITDHLSWEEVEHIQKLQDKLNSYLGFIEQGELQSSYPSATRKAIRINIVCKYQPSSQAIDLLNKAAVMVNGYGAKLSWSTPNS